MNLERHEQQILALIEELPIIRRIRLALTVLRGIEPQQIESEVGEALHPWETAAFFQELEQRYEAMVSGTDKGMSLEEVIAAIDDRWS